MTSTVALELDQADTHIGQWLRDYGQYFWPSHRFETQINPTDNTR